MMFTKIDTQRKHTNLLLIDPLLPLTPKLPGGGAAYLTGGVHAHFHDTTFKRTSVANGNGGAVDVASDFAMMNETDRSAAEFTRCTFEDFEADFHGQAAFSLLAELRLVDSQLADADGGAAAAGTVVDFGIIPECVSGCGPGSFGTCTEVRELIVECSNPNPNPNLDPDLGPEPDPDFNSDADPGPGPEPNPSHILTQLSLTPTSTPGR